jgi:hypothetical protein
VTNAEGASACKKAANEVHEDVEEVHWLRGVCAAVSKHHV